MQGSDPLFWFCNTMGPFLFYQILYKCFLTNVWTQQLLKEHLLLKCASGTIKIGTINVIDFLRDTFFFADRIFQMFPNLLKCICFKFLYKYIFALDWEQNIHFYPVLGSIIFIQFQDFHFENPPDSHFNNAKTNAIRIA